MITFDVQDMSCGHCVASITQAVKEADPGATVEVDLSAKRVRIEPARSDAPALQGAIAEAGYTPVLLEAA